MDGPALVLDPEKLLTADLCPGTAFIGAFPSEVWLSITLQCRMRGCEHRR